MGLSLAVGLLSAVFLSFVISAVAGNEPTRSASDYRLYYREPSGCAPDNCTYFVGIDTNTENKSLLDFYLVGRTEGWVAVGFTKTDSMALADVLGCSIHNGDLPLIIDTQNLKSQKVNRLDDSEINGTAYDVIEYSKEYTDGRIICNFSRSIDGIDPYPQDLALNTGYYLQFGLGYKSRGTPDLTHFSYHEGRTPQLTTTKYNPSTDRGQITISNLRARLIAAHGILMLVAWPILSFTAILFATWMKPALPNGQWFQVHRAFNLAGLLVGVVAFILVFIAHKDKEIPGLIDLGNVNKIGTAHFALGILIMALQIANPIISMCRCKPDHKFRWMFFLVHGLIIGYGLQILAYANAGIGVHIYGKGRTDLGNLTLLWIYVAFAAFSVVLACVLFAVFTGEAIIFKRDALSIAPSLVKMFLQCRNKYTELTHSPPLVEMSVSASYTANTQVVTTKDPLTPSPAQGPKVASRDAPIRWLGMVAFLLVTVPAMIAIIVLMIVRMN